MLTRLNLSTISSRQTRLSTMLRVSGTEVRSVAAGDCDDDDDDDDDAGSEGGHDVTEERFPRC